jgi:hypothetical protein
VFAPNHPDKCIQNVICASLLVLGQLRYELVSNLLSLRSLEHAPRESIKRIHSYSVRPFGTLYQRTRFCHSHFRVCCVSACANPAPTYPPIALSAPRRHIKPRRDNIFDLVNKCRVRYCHRDSAASARTASAFLSLSKAGRLRLHYPLINWLPCGGAGALPRRHRNLFAPRAPSVLRCIS